MTVDELFGRFAKMSHPEKMVTLFTYLISPPTIFSCLGFAIPWLVDEQWIRWGIAYNALIVLLPLVVVGTLLRLGKIQSVSMSQHERRGPYFLTFSTTIITWVILQAMNAPPLLLSLCLVTALALFGLFVTNLWWKISNHATASISAALLWGIVDNWTVGIVLIMLTVLVCAGRLYLGKHTIMQLVGGVVWGSTITLVIWKFGGISIL